jgi:TonB-linked SusC/RagA family outer membrane protein
MLMLVSALAFAQTRSVTGRVLDAQGRPVPFASITIRGTNTGVAADENGNFTIQAAPNATLVFSASGFQTSEVNIGSQTTVNASMSSQTSLNEVVVTALGVRRTRNQVPYAAQQVTGDEVSKNRSSNFVQNLSGKVAGLELRQSNTLGGSTNVVLRGTKTISNPNQALFVIDGVPIDNSNIKSIDATTGVNQQNVGRGGYDYGSAIADINPDDIESITVLKGAASTALYGSRGGNGVILITTKKGTRGLGITVNTSVGMGHYDPSTFAKYQQEYGGGYGTYYEDPSGYFLYRDINGDGIDDLVVPTSEDASYGGRFDVNKMVYQWDSFDTSSANYGKARPWLPAVHGPSSIFQTAWSSNQSVTLDGGSDRGTFKLGFTRTDDWGIMPNSKITKNMVNFGGTFDVTKRLTAGASINFTGLAGRGRYGTGYDDKNLMTNFRQWFQTNVDVLDQKAAYFRHRQNVTWNWADPTDLSPIYWDNPYFTRYENYETDSRNRFFGNVNLNYKITDWLSALGRVSQDFYTDLTEERQAKGSTTVSNYTRGDRTVRETNYDLMVNMDKDVSTDFNLKALLGTNVRKQNNSTMISSTNGGLIIDRIYSLANSVNPINPPLEIPFERQVLGTFGGVTLSWRNMLTIDGTLRNDRSSTLPKGNNSYWYPSVSMGWTFSRLVPSANWMSYGKLRANYAQVGNDANPYATADYYTLGTPFAGNPLASVSGTKANPNLLPERTKSYEVGLELSFLKNRLGLDITYYNAKTFDQIFPVPVSTTTGYNSKWLNAGNVRNKGIELSVNGAPIQTSNFSWNINVNWTRNRNKVEELTPGIDNVVLGTFQGGVSLNATLGQPYGTIRGNDYVYTNGQRTISATTGRPLLSSSANIVIGDVNPDWIGGVNNTLKYKNVSLSWLIDVRQGGDLFSLDLYYGLATGLYPETAGNNELGNPSRLPIASGGGVILSGVNPDGKTNTKRAQNVNYGLYGYVRNPNKAFVYDASYVKLREAVLTYSIPKTLVSRLHSFKGIDLSLIGRNLWIIHKNLPYADPEEIISAGNLQGYQVGAYPSVRTFTFNVKLRF